MDLASPLVGLALGLSLAAPPGPMNALIAAYATRHGARPAVRVGLAAPIVDTGYLLVVAFGLSTLVDVTPYVDTLSVVGGGLMLFIAAQVARGSVAAQPAQLPGFRAMALLSLTNPYQIGWWLTLGASFLHDEGLAGAGGFLVAIFAWVFVFAFAMAHGARRWAWFEPVTLLASVAVMVSFGLAFIMRATA